MSHIVSAILLASLLMPTGLAFITESAVDFPYADVARPTSPVRIINNSFGLETTAQSIVVVDDASDTILYSKDPAAVRSIASVTKLVTALVFLDTAPDWNALVTIQSSDMRAGGIARLIPGEQVTVRQLFETMLVASSNEAAVALARISGVPDFTAAMNQKARQLGMWQSYFTDPSGLEKENVSRPADLLALADAAFINPDIAAALTKRQYQFTVANTGRAAAVETTNELLSSFLNTGEYTIVGAKTGYLDEAGYCLLLRVAKTDGASVTVVLLGTTTPLDRWQEAKGLVDWVFANYQWPVAATPSTVEKTSM